MNLTWSSPSVVPHARPWHDRPIAAHPWARALHGVKAGAHRAAHAHVRPWHVAHVHVPISVHTSNHAWTCTMPNKLVRNKAHFINIPNAGPLLGQFIKIESTFAQDMHQHGSKAETK